MKTRVRLERIIVIAGILVVLFLTLVTSSYYQNVLNQVGKDGGEDGNEYRYHYVMIVEDCDMPFWKDGTEHQEAQGAQCPGGLWEESFHHRDESLGAVTRVWKSFSNLSNT